MQYINRIMLALILFGTLPSAYAVEGESIVLDSRTGNYLITHYSDLDRKFETLIFIPATKIKPTIKCKHNLTHEGIVRYEYNLISGRDSQQVIVGILFDPVSSVTTPMPDIPLNAPPGKIMGDMQVAADYFETPRLWHSMMSYSEGQNAFRIGWLIKVANGLAPGNQATFGFRSRDLPGIIQARVDGYAPKSQKIDGEELPDAEDGGFGQQYFALLMNNYLLRPVAAPTIAVPAPFDAAVLLDRIRTQVATWPGKQLLDPAFATQLERNMVAAANAFRNNQPKAGREHIESLRRLLDHEHKYLDHDDEDNDDTPEHKAATRLTIDRLAAWVLDFDLRYVLKRIEKEHEHDHDEGDRRKEQERK